MAKSIIEIEVLNGDKARATINEIEISLESVGKTAKDAREELKKAIDNTTDALIGSVKTLNRERNGWVEVQQSLSTTNAEYRRYQVEIDKIDKKIAKLTDTRKKEEKVMKGSANAIKQQIAALKLEQANRTRTSGGYQRAQKEIDKLEQQYRQLTGAQQGTVAYYDQEIARLRELQRSQAKSRAEVQKLEKQIADLRLKQNLLTGETKNLSKASQSFSSSAGAAGATVTEFGRTIGDAPFGLMGMANNIQQLSQQFVDLKTKSGGTREALIEFKNTLLGPAGIVVAVNIITSAIVAYNMRKEKAKEKAEDFTNAMLLEGSVLKQLTEIYNLSNQSLGTRNQIMSSLAAADSDYAKALADLGKNEEARAELTSKYLDIRNRINDSEEKRNSIAEDNKDLLSEEILSKEERNRLEEEYERLLSGPLDESIGRAIANIKGLLNLDDQRIEANLEITKSTNDIADAQEELNRLLDASEYDKAIQNLKAYKEELRLLDNFKEGPERLAEELRVLKEKLAKEAVKAGTTETAAYQEILLNILKKEREIYETNEEIKQEASDKEAERLDNLADLNQEYRDKLMEQDDESGIVRLNIAQRDAVAQAKALGASQEEIARIEEYYEGERSKLRIKIAEDEAKEKEKIEDDAQKKKDKALKANEKKLDEYFKREIDLMKERTNAISQILSGVGQLFDELNNISQARFERQINSLNEERDIIRTNDNLTKEEKEKQLTDLQIKENDIQRKRIKSERDMFTLKQAITLAEMIMKQRAFVQEQIMLASLTAAKAQASATNVMLTGAEETAEANMSLGTFMKTLGPFGTAAFALSIGGVIASIVAARRKARAEIAGLSDAPISLGGSGSTSVTKPSAPDFNVVGASAQNQLAEAIGSSQREPLRAYVVSSDVTSAQEMDRKVVEAASI